MAPKAGRKRAGSSAAPLPTKQRPQANRRDLKAKVERLIKEKVHGHLSAEVIATEKVNNKLLEDHLADALCALPSGGRLATSFWDETLSKYGARTNALANMVPTNPNEVVSDEVHEHLLRAVSPDNKVRSSEPLFIYLQYGVTLNEKGHL